MAAEQGAPGGARSEFEKVQDQNASLPREVWRFLALSRKWWLIPALVTFAAVAGLLLLTSTAAATFIYTLF